MFSTLAFRCELSRITSQTRLPDTSRRSARKQLVTTTLQYDSDGNLIQKNLDGAITTYQYDYATERPHIRIRRFRSLCSPNRDFDHEYLSCQVVQRCFINGQ